MNLILSIISGKPETFILLYETTPGASVEADGACQCGPDQVEDGRGFFSFSSCCSSSFVVVAVVAAAGGGGGGGGGGGCCCWTSAAIESFEILIF